MPDHFPSESDRYRLLIDNTEAFALIMLDADGYVRTWNPGAERLFGWTAAEIIGQPSMVLWPLEDQAARADLAEMEAAKVVGEVPDERWHLRRDGTRVWVNGATTAVHDDDGRLVAFAKVGRDASMRQRTFEALQQEQSEIQQAYDEVSGLADSLRGDLEVEQAEVRRLADELAEAAVREQRRLASILHDDLQQLLVGAGLRIQLLRRRARGEEADALEAVSNALSEAVATTRTLASRLVPPDVFTDSLSSVLRWLADNVAQTYGLQVTLEVADVDAPAVREALAGHVRLALFQAARELLFNVVKHAGTQEARLSVRLARRHVALVVEDRGSGLSPDRKPGYGLADIEKRLAAVGGTLKVQPAPGGGTRAVIMVPSQGRGGASPLPEGPASERPAHDEGTA